MKLSVCLGCVCSCVFSPRFYFPLMMCAFRYSLSSPAWFRCCEGKRFWAQTDGWSLVLLHTTVGRLNCWKTLWTHPLGFSPSQILWKPDSLFVFFLVPGVTVSIYCKYAFIQTQTLFELSLDRKVHLSLNDHFLSHISEAAEFPRIPLEDVRFPVLNASVVGV